MSEQGEAAAKMSKSQKKKKAAQKKKLAKKNIVEEVVQDAEWWSQRRRDEIDALTMDEFNDKAISTREFQMLNIRGKLLVHPSKRFLEAISNLRQSMGRESYPLKVKNIKRLQSLGFHKSIIPSWSMGGHTSFIPLNNLLLDSKGDAFTGANGDSKPSFIKLFEPPRPRPRGAYADQSCGTVGLMVWYPIMSLCMAAGDKLACIALRDTCVILRKCYNVFRSDMTRLEQFVFDPMNPNNVKQLEWVARRLEKPPSPPQTPTSDTTLCEPLRTNDPFRFPAVLNKRWSDYDDDDESLGSPMSLPTPESSFDVPHLDLNVPQGARTKTGPPTYVVAIPILTNTAPWFSTKKTILPVPRISIHIPEEYPRSSETTSIHPMKLSTSISKPFPDDSATSSRRTRGRIERWVREDVEQNLRAKLALSGAAKKQADSEAELVIYNKITAFTALDSDKIYMGEADILGAGVGVCVEDVREVVLGRFKGLEKESGGRKRRSAQDAILKTWDKVVLVPSAEGWICKQLPRDGI